MTGTNINPKDHIAQHVVQSQSDYYGIVRGSKYPVDMELLLESVYDVSIVPTSNLEREHQTDTVLAADFKTIYVDLSQYMNHSYDTRIRFSLAHELGHIRLHRGFFQAQVQTVSRNNAHAFHYHTMNDQKYRKHESEAHEFAGSLLVPRGHLVAEASQEILNNIDVLYDSGVTIARLLNAMSSRIALAFGVSDAVIARRIAAEKLAEYFELDEHSPINQVEKPELTKRLNRLLDISMSFGKDFDS